jgi:hypothetical protein
MAVISYNAYETAVTVLNGAASGELVSLAHGSMSAVTDGTHGIILDNTSLLDLYADFELQITSAMGATPLARSWFRLYMYTSLDGGTNYEASPAAGVWNPDLSDDMHKVGDFYVPVGSSSTPGRMHLRGIPMRPGKAKFQLFNMSGAAFPATGSKLDCYRYNLKSV